MQAATSFTVLAEAQEARETTVCETEEALEAADAAQRAARQAKAEGLKPADEERKLAAMEASGGAGG